VEGGAGGQMEPITLCVSAPVMKWSWVLGAEGRP
jgi:hypothetical protein